jgi:hypothetical protein
LSSNDHICCTAYFGRSLRRKHQIRHSILCLYACSSGSDVMVVFFVVIRSFARAPLCTRSIGHFPVELSRYFCVFYFSFLFKYFTCILTFVFWLCILYYRLFFLLMTVKFEDLDSRNRSSGKNCYKSFNFRGMTCRTTQPS